MSAYSFILTLSLVVSASLESPEEEVQQLQMRKHGLIFTVPYTLGSQLSHSDKEITFLSKPDEEITKHTKYCDV